MISIKNLLEMIATEAVEGDGEKCRDYDHTPTREYEKPETGYSGNTEGKDYVDFTIELIRKSDGRLEWKS